MMKIITEIFRMPTGSLISLLYAVSDDGQVDLAVTGTLCEFVSLLYPPADAEFEDLLTQVKAGTYQSANPLLADFGVNDVNVWFATRNQKDECIFISNENIPDYSIDHGPLQQFSIQEFHAVSACWKKFQQKIRENGAERYMGQKFETVITSSIGQ